MLKVPGTLPPRGIPVTGLKTPRPGDRANASYVRKYIRIVEVVRMKVLIGIHAICNLQPMGRRVEPAQLVGASEIAARLAVKRPQVVHDWRRRHDDFPEPVAKLRTALIWYWPDVEAWARMTGRLS